MGDDWSEMRLAAAERTRSAPVPTPDEEIWRYSRIDRFDPERYTPAASATTVTGSHADLVVTDREPEVFADETPDVFADLNRAFMTPTVISIPRGRASAEPIVVTHRLGGDGIAVFPRLVIDAGENSEVTVVERFVAADGAELDQALVVPVVQIRAAQASRVTYLALNEAGDATWQIGNQQAVGDRDSSVTLATVTLGGDYVRARTEARISGQGGSTKQVALYFAGGGQMHDFRT
ncbi:MAG: SufD family Fe-S cluster assembly protein, partial [Actinomycetota bacterium]